jgi:hypothetical protein
VAQSAPGPWDVRWGFIFISPRGQRIGTIYIDGIRDGAVIDGRYVLIEGGLLRRLKAALFKDIN